MQRFGLFLFGLLGLLLFWPLLSQADSNATQRNNKQTIQKEVVKTTRHQLKTRETEFSYLARTGEIIISPGKRGKDKASIFYIAYEIFEPDQKNRPVTFAFNGGPGAASVWLHLGALGPKMVNIQRNGTAPPPPAQLKPNLYSWLIFTDLVFIDPVGTGYSRSLDKQENNKFFGVEKDIRAIAEFIRLYLTRQERWLDPKFLTGESYGTLRAAALTTYLDQNFGVKLNGAILISPALDYATLDVHNGRNLPFALFLPSYAATAAYHNQTESLNQTSLKNLLNSAEDFAMGDYINKLLRGDRLSQEKFEILCQRTSKLTGLSLELVRKHRAKIKPGILIKNLLSQQERILGRMDTTVTGIDLEPGNDFISYDPSLRPLFGPFSSAINSYIRQELEFKSNKNYEFLNTKVTRNWDWCSTIQKKALGQGYVSAADNLKKAMTVNEHFKVFVASGLYDLATPYLGIQYTISQMDLDPSVRSNLTLKRYQAGHMIYLHSKARKQLFEDVRKFYCQAVPVQ